MNVCKKTNSQIKKFWCSLQDSNSHCYAFKSWKYICKPKQLVGQGFKSFHELNIPLLTKLGWSLVTNLDKMWAIILIHN